MLARMVFAATLTAAAACGCAIVVSLSGAPSAYAQTKAQRYDQVTGSKCKFGWAKTRGGRRILRRCLWWALAAPYFIIARSAGSVPWWTVARP